MNILYKCCFCEKQYDWYDGIYENPNYNLEEEFKAKRNKMEYGESPGVFIVANSIALKNVAPVDDRINGEALKVANVNGNLSVYINICKDCMRKIIDNLHMDDDSAWNVV